MSLQGVWSECLRFLDQKPVVVENSAGRLSSDAGLLVDQFLDAFEEPPLRLTFDLDGFDDPAHGAQQLTLFHAYYKQNQYFPLIVTNAETGLAVMVALRHGTAHAAEDHRLPRSAPGRTPHPAHNRSPAAGDP